MFKPYLNLMLLLRNGGLTAVLAFANIGTGDTNFAKIRQLRKQKGSTQQQLARKLGYKTNSYISDVESGHFVLSREKLKKIAKALGIPFRVFG